MKKILSLLLLLAVVFAVKAQQDPKAKKILDKVSVKTKAYKTITVDFTYTLDNNQEDISETSKGKIIIKGNKYKLDLMGAEIFFDGTTSWTYMPDAEEVNVSEPDEDDENAIDPSKIFTLYEQGFKYKFIAEKFEDAYPIYEIDLYPTDREKSYSRIKLKINKSKMMLHSVKYVGKDGNDYTIKIIKLTPDIAVSDSSFKFDTTKYPDVEVNDMR